MARYVDKVLAVGGETDGMVVVGNCDISIQGLTSGSVKLQYKPQATSELPSPAFVDFPEATYTVDTYATLFMSDNQTTFKLVGVSNNSGVYVKISSYLND